MAEPEVSGARAPMAEQGGSESSGSNSSSESDEERQEPDVADLLREVQELRHGEAPVPEPVASRGDPEAVAPENRLCETTGAHPASGSDLKAAASEPSVAASVFAAEGDTLPAAAAKRPRHMEAAAGLGGALEGVPTADALPALGSTAPAQAAAGLPSPTPATAGSPSPAPATTVVASTVLGGSMATVQRIAKESFDKEHSYDIIRKGREVLLGEGSEGRVVAALRRDGELVAVKLAKDGVPDQEVEALDSISRRGRPVN